MSRQRTEAAGTDRVSTIERGRAERWHSVRVDEGEMGETSLCSTLREEKTATTWGGGHWWCTVTAKSPGMCHARAGDCREPFKQPLRMTSAARTFSDFSRFSIFQILKSKSVTFLMSKIHQISCRDSWKHREQLFLLAKLKIPSGSEVTISRTNSNLNLL
jgi:hypothetical protein